MKITFLIEFMEIILIGIVVGTLIVYGCLLLAAFCGEEETKTK